MAIFSNLRQRALRHDRERGAILILSALIMILLLFIAAFATDLGAWYRQGQAQQRAADVGSLNGMQAYDREYKAYFDANGVQTWTQLTDQQRFEAERQAMLAAINTIVGLLETSGHSFSSAPTEVQVSPPPNSPGDQSIYTITSDDGTLVTITREADGMSVSLSADGDQYFSNLLRDAPQITRKSTAVLSNCGAECTRSIVINPPFAGFAASGSGDGHKPLLRGDTEIWAVNHHIYSGWDGDIVCMDRETESSCGNFSLGSGTTVGYNTPNRPVELLSNNVDKIYAPATRRVDNRAGLLCFDVARKQYCTTPFIDFWNSGNSWSSPSIAVWEYGGNAWVLSHHGEIACVTTSSDASGGMQSCGEYNTAIFGTAGTTTEGAGSNRTAWGERIGNQLYLMSRNGSNDPLFHCFNLDTRTPCWGGSIVAPGSNYRNYESIGFLRHSTGGALEGYCVAVPQNNDRHYCVDFAGNALSQLPNFASVLTPLGNSWTGASITWEGQRTFFAGGISDRVTCYDWQTRASCGEVDLEAILPGSNRVNGPGDRSNTQQIEPYAFEIITPECIIGLGDQSYFYSFSPVTLDACVDTKLNTQIFPCECADGANKWGEVRLPAELIAKVDSIRATVSLSENGAAINASLDDVDLLANDGVLDLRSVDQSHDVLYLLLEVDAKLGPDDKPVWQSPITADLQIVVQPTLSN